MLNETDNPQVQFYNSAAEHLTKYIGMIVYVLCLFGILMNILTFAQQQPYGNRASSLYLLSASTCDLIYLCSDPLINILQYAFHYDLAVQLLIPCQIKSYIAFTAMLSAATLTTLAHLSQYLLSSDQVSRWYYARRHIGIRFIKITFVVCFLVSIPILLCSKPVSNASNDRRSVCSNPAYHVSCFWVKVIYICFLNGFLPPILMIIFSLLTRHNVRRLNRRSKRKSIGIRRINQQLMLMLTLQALKWIVTSMPYAIFTFYQLSTNEKQKSSILKASETFVHQAAYILFWSNYTSFYIYVGVSDIFRDQWVNGMKKLVCCRYGKRQRRSTILGKIKTSSL